jgi:hypothetical protein
MSWFASEESGHSKWSLHKFPHSGRAKFVSVMYLEFTGKGDRPIQRNWRVDAGGKDLWVLPELSCIIAVGDPHLLMAAMVTG